MTSSDRIGPMVLAGSGEYTTGMDLVDEHFSKQVGDRSVLVIATACAPEGDDIMANWEQMGMAHFKRFGIDATPVRIRDQAEANIAENAEKIAEAGFIWFSGGRAFYLAQAFENTLAWEALEGANRRGAIVAGSSGGLGVLNINMVDRGADIPQDPTGLGLAAPVRALAHFDRMEARRPEFVQRTVALAEPGQKVVGVDEDTAIVWSEGVWQVMGRQRAVVFESDGQRQIYHHGDQINELPTPARIPASN